MTSYEVAVWGSGPLALLTGLALQHQGVSVCVWGAHPPVALHLPQPWIALVPVMQRHWAAWGVDFPVAHQGVMRDICVHVGVHTHRFKPYLHGEACMAVLCRYDVLRDALQEAVSRAGVPCAWGVKQPCHMPEQRLPWQSDEGEARVLVVAEGHASDWASQRHVQQPMGSSDEPEQVWTAAVSVEKPHHHVGRQLFTTEGVLGMLPTDHAHVQSWVWSGTQTMTERGQRLGWDTVLRHHAEPWVGQFQLLQTPQPRSIARFVQTHWAGPDYALLGDTARRVHPLCGQGMNMGCADVIAWLQAMQQHGIWPHPQPMLEHYARHARSRAQRMIATVEHLKTALAHWPGWPQGVQHALGWAWDHMPCWDHVAVGRALHVEAADSDGLL